MTERLSGASRDEALAGLEGWTEVEGRDAIHQRSILGFEIEDTLYLVGPITWLGVLEPFILLSGIGTPLFLIYVLYDAGRMLKARGSRRA